MITKGQLENYWIENEQKFKDIIQNVPYQKKGIWYTEAFLFCSICDILKVDAIIESGVAYGCSTEIFANYFDFNIVAIDSDQYDIFSDTSKRLEKYNNLSLIKGNSFELIPNIIEENLDANVGIFIDGPKGREARRLRDNLLKFNKTRTSHRGGGSKVKSSRNPKSKGLRLFYLGLSELKKFKHLRS